MLSSQQLVANALKKINEISVSELAKINIKGINLIDIREADEIVQGMIPNSMWIPRGILEFQIHELFEQLNWNYKDTLYLTCRSGNRTSLRRCCVYADD